ncbi:MAG TPA: ribulose-phosphate 3-epimerase [Anaerolineaceae bacterium]
MKQITISTSILSADFRRLEQQIIEAETGGVDWIHVDVMDGHFVPNLTMGPFIVETCRKITTLPLDVHLMVEKPENLIDAYARAGANWLTIHIESCPQVYRTLEYIRSIGCHPGIVLNPGTPASAITEVLPLVDLVLVMTVNPGYSGQSFIPAMLPKIRNIHQAITEQNSQAIIEVDGGITPETLPLTYQAGARVFVAATAIFKNPAGIAAGIHALRSSVP